MGAIKNPFLPIAGDTLDHEFARLSARPVGSRTDHATSATVLGRLQGFDIDDRPLVGLSEVPGEWVPARTTVNVPRSALGSEVVVVFAGGNVCLPIILGVIQSSAISSTEPTSRPVTICADGERLVLDAEREIVLRCGEASITLTRAGKVIIKGHYIVSRSTGYNKIKGAAVDIN